MTKFQAWVWAALPKAFVFFLLYFFLSSTHAQVYINGYYRSNGTYVEPYVRSSPNSGSSSTNTSSYSTPSYSTPTYSTPSANTVNPESVWVNGYYRSDGTYVEGYYRTAPNNTVLDNYSHYGNVNPYTGAIGTKDPYLDNNNYPYSYTPPTDYTPPTNYTSNSNSTPAYSNSNTTFNDNTGYTYYVTSNSLNLRSGPSIDSSIITSLKYGSKVSVLSYDTYWYKVRVNTYDYYGNPKTYFGYVYNQYVSLNVPSDYSSTASANTYQGGIGFYTNCPNDGMIDIYVDDFYIGRLERYLDNGTPPYGGKVTVSFKRPIGSYKVVAKGATKTWTTYINVIDNSNKVYKLECN